MARLSCGWSSISQCIRRWRRIRRKTRCSALHAALFRASKSMLQRLIVVFFHRSFFSLSAATTPKGNELSVEFRRLSSFTATLYSAALKSCAHGVTDLSHRHFSPHSHARSAPAAFFPCNPDPWVMSDIIVRTLTRHFSCRSLAIVVKRGIAAAVGGAIDEKLCTLEADCKRSGARTRPLRRPGEPLSKVNNDSSLFSVWKRILPPGLFFSSYQKKRNWKSGGEEFNVGEVVGGIFNGNLKACLIFIIKSVRAMFVALFSDEINTLSKGYGIFF